MENSKMVLSELNGVLLTLHVSGLQKLYLMLSADGTIRRSGDGSAECCDTSVYVGTSDGTAYAMAMSLANDVQQWIGSYVAPEQNGDSCLLVIGFKATDGAELTSEWEYGAQSQGPPPEIVGFTEALIQATDQWHESQKLVNVRTGQS